MHCYVLCSVYIEVLGAAPILVRTDQIFSILVRTVRTKVLISVNICKLWGADSGAHGEKLLILVRTVRTMRTS